jgi:hypothetical protein
VRRRLLNLLTGVSMLLCGAVCVLWVLSYTLRPEVFHVGFDRRAAALHNGSVQFHWLKRFELVSIPQPSGVPVAAPGKPLPYLADSPGWHYDAPPRLQLPAASRDVVVRPLATLSGGAVPHSGIIQGGGFEVSLWPVAVFAAGLPCLWIIRRRGSAAARRRAAGLCPWCGYDLRATPGRCPECGHQSGPVEKLSEV